MVAKKKATQSKKQAVERICFTIMPFGGWFDDYYSSIFCPAIKAAGFTPKRADDLYRPSTIVTDIWSYTKKSEIILADLSGKNPNVFYELGLAHALAKPAILVVESMDDVPFDLRALRVIVYDKNVPDWGALLGEKIEKAIEEISQSPTESVLPAFLNAQRQQSTKTSMSERDLELLELRQEVGRLSREIRVGDRPSYSESMISRLGAERLLDRWLRMGMSSGSIKRRLRDRGVPSNWIEDKLAKYSHQEELELSGEIEEEVVVERGKSELPRKKVIPKKAAPKKKATTKRKAVRKKTTTKKKATSKK